MPFAIPDKDRAQAFAIPEQDRDQAARAFDPRQMPDPSGGQPMDFSPLHDFARGRADAVRRYYQNLGNMAGLPVAPLTPEEAAANRQEIVNAAGMLGGAGIGAGISRLGQALFRGFLRGGSRPATKRFLEANAKHIVPEGARATTSMGKAALPPVAGIATEISVDASIDALGEYFDDLISIPAGLGAAGLAASQVREDLLIRNPKFRAAAEKASRAGLSAKVIGGLAGWLFAQLYPENEQ